MKKTLRKVIVVKRFITFVGLFCLLIVCLTGQAQIKEKNWNRIPENQKTAFLVSGPDNQVMYIQCFISTLENWRLLLEEQWEEGKESTTGVQSLLEALFPGQTILFVWVTNGPRAQSFSPTNFVFTQGKQQYEVSLSDIYPLDKQFVGGEVEPYAVVKGFIAIPEGIDLTKPFMIRYGEAFGVIAQAQQGPGTTTPVQPPTRPGVPSGPIRVPGDYPTISAALQAAPQGAEIHVSRGTYRGDLLVTRPVAITGEKGAVIQGNLTIQGAQNVTLNTVEIRGRVEIRNSTDVTISRVHVSGSPSIGVVIEDSTATISECQIEGSAGVGVDISFGGRVILRDCEIAGSGGDGVRVGFGAQARIVSTTIRDSSGDGLEITGGTVELLGNRFVDNRGYGIHAHSGATLLGERNRGQGNKLGLASEEVPIEVASIQVPQEMSLEEAIQKAGQTPILLAPGEYEGGTIRVLNEVNIQGAGDEPGACVIKDLEARGSRWVISNLTLQSSNIDAAEVQFSNCHVKGVNIGGDTQANLGNSLISHLSIAGTAQVVITNSRVSDSETSGIYVWGSARVNLSNTTISNNGEHGVYVGDKAQVTLENCTVSGNKWTGLEIKGEAQVSLVDCAVESNGTDNKQDSEDHSGIIAGAESRLTLRNCTVSKNVGSGLYAVGEAQVRLENSALSANIDGLDTWGTAQVSLKDCIISGNEDYGLIVDFKTQVRLENSTISDNGRNGLFVAAYGVVTVTGGEISGNGEAGIKVWNSARVELREEISIHDNCSAGIYVAHPEAQVVGGPATMWGNGVPLRGFVSASIRKPLTPQTQRTELTVPGDYSTIQEAIDAVAPGGTITLGEGTFHEAFTIWKSVAIRGAGPDRTILAAPPGVPTVVAILAEARNVRVADLTITEVGETWRTVAVGMDILGGVELVNVRVVDNEVSGILAYGAARLTLRGCEISGNEGSGLWLRDQARLETIEDSWISDNWGCGIRMPKGGELRGRNNWVKYNYRDFCGCSPPQGFLRESPPRPLREGEVEVCPTCEFAQLGEAIRAAAPGATIRLGPGHYSGPVMITKDLNLIGAGPGCTQVAGIRIGGNSVVELRDLTISNSYTDGLRIGVEARVTLVNCALSDNEYDGLYIDGEAQVILRGCTISENGAGGLIKDLAQVSLENSTITKNGGYGLGIRGSAQVGLTSCTIDDNGRDGIVVAGKSQLMVHNCVIRNNAEWGLIAVLDRCGFFLPWPGWPEFTGEVTLQNNKIYGNGEGDVCLPDLCIPEDACK